MFKSAIALSFVALAFSACSKQDVQQLQKPAQPPVVTASQIEKLDESKPSVAPDTTTSTAVRVTLTVDKQALLSQEFLYGADLQYSSFYDKGMDLYNQSLALGHIPARFRIAGDELQLVAANTLFYPSEVNHPEQLLSRFKIVAQTDTSLVISTANSGVYLAEVMEGTHTDTAGGMANPAGKLRDSWVRSFDYDASGNYLLQQTSVMMDDGTIGEFMEAIFPRANTAVGSDFQKFEMDPDDAVGADDGVVSRFRMLPGFKIFRGEKKVAYAQHFDISSGGTIDWWVTRNIPEEDLAPVQQAVEAWNRYFTKYKGIERQVMRFRGRLPEGIHLGDPRFNVINWDSRLIAGAAYESQATDPETGKQSHSLIYMPAAWLKIGTDYWTLGRASDDASVAPKALAQRSGLFSAARVSCMRDLRGIAELATSGRLSSDEVQTFGVELLKQTLFHEVGHALGLAHNFKGSLTFDRSKPGSPATSSIMDYNDFEIERYAFYGVNTADGPLLEYDRQALSAIYNQGKDIAATDAIVPACNDAEADTEDKGVDPLCIRYDIENDPTHSVTTALNRSTQATLDHDVTLAQALGRASSLVLTDDAIAAAKTEADAKALAASVAKSLKGSVNFYLVGGKASLSRVVRTNVKALYKYEKDVLPAGYDELAMRERAFDGVQKSVALTALPDVAAASLASAVDSAVQALAKTPYVASLDATAAQTSLAGLKSAIQKAAGDGTNDLATLRKAVFATLARHDAVDFFLGTLGTGDSATQLDYETSIVGLLGDAVTATSRTVDERVAAATSLASFKDRGFDDAIQAVTDKVTAERKAAKTNDSRSNAIKILAALSK